MGFFVDQWLENGVTVVTVATFENIVDAHIALGRLQAEGIPCHLSDENLVQADWLYSIAVGGIKLQVEADFADHARRVLATDYSQDAEDGAEP